jgi:BlaI family penicillinase repressor
MDKTTIGNAELRLLEFIESSGPITVRQMWETHGAEQGYVRTTLLQMAERLRAKGLLSRVKGEGGFLYRAASASHDVRKGALRRFIEGTLGGSVSPLVQHLVEQEELSPEDLRRLQELVERLKEREVE